MGLEACLEESTGLATGTIVIIVVASVLIVVIAGVVVVKGHCCDDDDDKEGDIEEAVPPPLQAPAVAPAVAPAPAPAVATALPSLQELGTLTGHRENVWALAWDAGSQTLFSGSWDDTIKVWSKQRGGAKYTVEATLTGHTGDVVALAWDAGSQTLFSGSYDDTIKLSFGALGSTRSCFGSTSGASPQPASNSLARRQTSSIRVAARCHVAATAGTAQAASLSTAVRE